MEISQPAPLTQPTNPDFPCLDTFFSNCSGGLNEKINSGRTHMALRKNANSTEAAAAAVGRSVGGSPVSGAVAGFGLDAALILILHGYFQQ
jgi:hypothetical protein